MSELLFCFVSSYGITLKKIESFNLCSNTISRPSLVCNIRNRERDFASNGSSSSCCCSIQTEVGKEASIKILKRTQFSMQKYIKHIFVHKRSRITNKQTHKQTNERDRRTDRQTDRHTHTQSRACELMVRKRGESYTGIHC